HGGGGAQFTGGDVVLRRQHEVLHQQADADAADCQVDAEQGEGGARVDGGQQAEPGAHDDRTRDQVALPDTGAADDLSGGGGRHQQTEDHRQAHQAGHGGRLAQGHLEVLRQEDGAAEHRHTDQQAGDGGERDGAVAEDRQRDHRLGRPGLDEHGGTQQHDAGPGEGGGLPGDPVEVVAGQRHPDEQRAYARDDQEGTQEVDLRLAPDRGQPQGALEQHDGEEGERQ